MRKPDPANYDSATYSKLMYVLEMLREADAETICKIHAALTAPKKVENGGHEMGALPSAD